MKSGVWVNSRGPQGYHLDPASSTRSLSTPANFIRGGSGGAEEEEEQRQEQQRNPEVFGSGLFLGFVC